MTGKLKTYVCDPMDSIRQGLSISVFKNEIVKGKSVSLSFNNIGWAQKILILWRFLNIITYIMLDSNNQLNKNFN